MKAGLLALPLVLVMTNGSTYAFGQEYMCYPIGQGDTAAHLAEHFTGDARNRYEAWFQIVDPTTATFIPKPRYGFIQSGWDVCIASAMLVSGSAQPVSKLYAFARHALPQPDVMREQTARYLNFPWWATSLLLVASGLIVWVAAEKYIANRQETLDIMRGFGDTFMAEFERPLFRRSPDDVPVRSRLRFAPGRRRLDILIAPAGGRTYPNLIDHRKNVEYDVGRVLQLLRGAQFIDGPLYAEGSWVVIPLRFETHNQQEGAP